MVESCKRDEGQFLWGQLPPPPGRSQVLCRAESPSGCAGKSKRRQEHMMLPEGEGGKYRRRGRHSRDHLFGLLVELWRETGARLGHSRD